MPAINVVKFESIIVNNDFLYATSKAIMLDFSTINSSFARSKIITFVSIAIPTVRIIPAIPGKVRVDPNRVNIEIKITTLSKREIFAKKPSNL